MSPEPRPARPAGRAPLRWRLVLALLRALPQRALSRAAGRLADLRLPRPLRRPVIGAFARLARIDTDEAEAPPAAYPSVGAYFVRRLREGARSGPADAGVPASPVDGRVGAFGPLDGVEALQAKGIAYSVAELLGDGSDAEAFGGGSYVTLYLSPRHYHRIHAPVSAAILAARSLPGRLLPVNAAALREVPRLFPGNERLVVRMESDAGPAALVAVGAYNVGRIAVAFDPKWPGAVRGGVTNLPGRKRVRERLYDPPIPIGRGDELAAFHLGSTVVVLFGGPVPAFHPALAPDREIRLGAPLFHEPP